MYGEAVEIFRNVGVLMAAVIKPDGLVVFAEVVDLIGPVQARADETVAEHQRLAGSFDAVEKAGAVEALDVAMGRRRVRNGVSLAGRALARADRAWPGR